MEWLFCLCVLGCKNVNIFTIDISAWMKERKKKWKKSLLLFNSGHFHFLHSSCASVNGKWQNKHNTIHNTYTFMIHLILHVFSFKAMTSIKKYIRVTALFSKLVLSRCTGSILISFESTIEHAYFNRCTWCCKMSGEKTHFTSIAKNKICI